MDDIEEAFYDHPLPATRTGPLYNAFSYPTKISPEAIALFIATHSAPGDTVLDVFGGSGTTGLAAKLCDKPTPAMLEQVAQRGLNPVWGPRHAVLYEIGSLGSFVSRVMCNPPDSARFAQAANELVAAAEAVGGWLYRTTGPAGETATIRHIVWSDVLVCPDCEARTPYWDLSYDTTRFGSRAHSRARNATPSSRQTGAHARSRPFTTRCSGAPRNVDVACPPLCTARRARSAGSAGRNRPTPSPPSAPSATVPASAPRTPMVWGDLYRSGYHHGISHVHHFYSARNFLAVATLWELIERFDDDLRDALRLLVLSFNASHSTLMTRVVVKHGQKDLVLTGAQSGVLYVSGLPVEKNVFEGVRRKVGTLVSAFALIAGSRSTVDVVNASSTDLQLDDGSVRYVFTDYTPFGAYIPYAEINQLNEAWLGTTTRTTQAEIVVSAAEGKDVAAYGELMAHVFAEIARVMADDALATVVFHSAKADVWRGLTSAYGRAGLTVRTTSVLDKTQVTFKQTVSHDDGQGRSAHPPDEAGGFRRAGGDHERRGHRRRRAGRCAGERASGRAHAGALVLALRYTLPRRRSAGDHRSGRVLQTGRARGCVMAVAEGVRDDGFRSDAERKKRLGQYFTGVRLARTLAALASAHNARSVIDPMAGSGDMLLGCLDHGAVPELIGAIEIDPSAHAVCGERLRASGAEPAAVVLGNAFSPDTIGHLPTTSWDVVITNPPYVRYQSVARAAGLEENLPSATEIRHGLIAIIGDMEALDATDKILFRKLVEGY